MMRSLHTAAAPVLLDTADVVWPGASHLEVTRSRRAPSGAVDYLVVPHVGSPRWLLPASAPSTADALLGRAHRAERSAVALVRMVQRLRLTAFLPLRRLRVETGPQESLTGVLQDVVGRQVEVALRLGSWADARSLVVRLFDPHGGTVAFGKVGIDEHGRSSVRDEHAALARVARLELQRVRSPRVLHRWDWRGLEVLLVSPLVAAASSEADDAVPFAAMEELARSGGSRIAALSASGWASSLRRRLAEVTGEGPGRTLRHELGRLERAAGGVELPLGLWHGDWTPWNMTRDGPVVLLWDWEHFAEDVPVGFDPVHYLAQRLRVVSGTGRSDEDNWRTQAAAVLRGRLGLTETQANTVVAAYLLEVNVRFVRDRQSTSERHRRREGWGLELLRREVDRVSARS